MDIILDFFEKLAEVGSTISSACDQVLEALSWLPAPLLALLGTGFASIVVLRIVGR